MSVSRPAPSISSLLRIKLGRIYQTVIGRLADHGGVSWLRYAPGSSRQWGPPRRRQLLSDYLQSNPGEWIEVFRPEKKLPSPSPLQCLPEQRHLLAALPPRPEFPSAGVACLPQTRVLGAAGWPVGANDTFLPDLANQGDSPICHLYTLRRLAPCQRLPGRTLNLASCWVDRNFGHFFLDTLPRLALVWGAGFKLEDFDHILVSRESSSASRWHEAAGLPQDRLIPLRPDSHWECEMLYQPSPTAQSDYYAPWVLDYHRSWPAPPCAGPARRLYVHRRGHRRNLVNESEVAARLADAGFEPFESTDPISDRQAFTEASSIVGVHGAGLALLACCRPGTSFLELAPSNHLLPHYRSLALEGGMNYGLLAGQPISHRSSSRHAPPTDVDFHLPVSDLERMLQVMHEPSRADRANY